MGFKKIDAPSIKELFATQVKEMILSGELKPGDRLPSERELAETMGISKTIVHEGIGNLVRMGFLSVKARKGVYVADYAKTGNLETLFAMMEFRGGFPDVRIVQSLLDMRIYLECPGIRMLAESRTEEQITELQLIIDQAVEAKGKKNISKLTGCLFEFHRTLNAMSGNAIIPLIMNAFFNASVPAWEGYCVFCGTEKVCRVMKDMLERIREQDSDGACAIFEEEIYLYKDYIDNNTSKT